jgi:hypothetical protein
VSNDALSMLLAVATELHTSRDYDPNAVPFFDLMSGGLVWSDERQANVRAVWALRPLWMYRTSVLLGVPDTRHSALWQEAQRIVPDWIGFHPARCTPSPELAALAVKLSREGAREVNRLERIAAPEEGKQP